MPVTIGEAVRRIQGVEPFGYYLSDSRGSGLFAVNEALINSLDHLCRIKFHYPRCRIVCVDKRGMLPRRAFH